MAQKRRGSKGSPRMTVEGAQVQKVRMKRTEKMILHLLGALFSLLFRRFRLEA
jgi:hypothetical protein